ncbi:amidohydrolase [Rhodothalassium salexigens]|uniref:amidohydrolase family protein n=1 Tax=Rhodothalassium salexigens TaxID=1086 RepID=UPI0019135353|nr:amidohydrolase family protein [Rhodothalassium salexigens]MBK5910717.1 amidohydrolase [Rhodothalassium salexigens]MBK5921653.1 amidohydrolase [Rhodothalassium salexigens]
MTRISPLLRRTYPLAALLACLIAAAALLARPAAAARFDPPPRTAIVGGTVLPLDGRGAIANGVILIEGDRIVAVGPASDVTVPDDARRIDATGRWLMPGLMNMHVHLALILPGAEAMRLRFETPEARALRAADNARRSLLAGTTTIRSTGDRSGATFAVRQAVEARRIAGPRIFASGAPIAPTGGHGTEPGSDGLDGPYEVRAAARAQIAKGADWIKIMISRGIASYSGDIAAADMTFDEMQAVTEIADRRGVQVTAHSGSPAATLEALEAGVDCFEHGYYLTPKVFDAMREAGAWYVPTIVVSQQGAMEFFRKIGSPQWYLDRAKSVGKVHWAALQAAVASGVDIAMGSDQFPFEPNEGTVASVREIELYVDAGMTPAQALRAATVNPARLLGASDELGTLSAGKYADIIGLDADPLADISALRTISLVMAGGYVHRNDRQAD